MKVKRCRLILASLTLVMFFGFSPFDWLSLVTDYFSYQSGTVVQQTVQNETSGDGAATPIALPSSPDSGGQCPMCPGPRPRPRPIPPGL